jgi:hypothetical protein
MTSSTPIVRWAARNAVVGGGSGGVLDTFQPRQGLRTQAPAYAATVLAA